MEAIVTVTKWNLWKWYWTTQESSYEFPPQFEVENLVAKLNETTVALDPAAMNLLDTLNEIYATPTIFSEGLSGMVKFLDISEL